MRARCVRADVGDRQLDLVSACLSHSIYAVVARQVHSFARLDLGAIYGRCMDNIARVDVQDEKYKDFGREYQSRSVPALINGAMHRWPAMGRWRMENFSADFGHQKIICDHRFGIRMRFNDFRDYMAEQAELDSFDLSSKSSSLGTHMYCFRTNKTGRRHATLPFRPRLR